SVRRLTAAERKLPMGLLPVVGAPSVLSKASPALAFIKALRGNNVAETREAKACYSAASAKRGIEGLWRPFSGCAAEPPKGSQGAVAAGRSTIEVCESKARPHARHNGYCGSTDRFHRPCRRGQCRGQEAISSRGGAICGRHGDSTDPDN